MNKMAVSSYLSIIALKVKELNVPVKRHRVAEWMKKTKPICLLPTEESLQT